MSEPAPAGAPSRVFVNIGCGPRGARIPACFETWQQIRVDIDPSVDPDVIASLTDLSPLPTGRIDAIYASHCLEHLYAFEVPKALAEIKRVLSPTGFALLLVPDLQSIARWILEDKLDEPIYVSPGGPVTAQDMIWGYGPAVSHGHLAMAHRTGFTPTALLTRLNQAGFAEIVLRRLPSLELAAVVLMAPSPDETARNRLLADLGL